MIFGKLSKSKLILTNMQEAVLLSRDNQIIKQEITSEMNSVESNDCVLMSTHLFKIYQIFFIFFFMFNSGHQMVQYDTNKTIGEGGGGEKKDFSFSKFVTDPYTSCLHGETIQ